MIAVNLARNNCYAVLPCLDDKRPACPHGFKDATSDLEAISELWRRYPGPLIGVATGEVSNLAVVDVDRKHDEARLWWRAHCSRLLPTRAYETRSGGLHLFYRHAEGVGSTAGKICLGVDTRGTGGYVIFWYAAGLECFDHSAPEQWPAWLSAELSRPKSSPRRKIAPVASANRTLDGLMHSIAEAREGERNQMLFWAASRCAERGMLRDATSALIAAAVNTGLSEVEARRTIASAARPA